MTTKEAPQKKEKMVLAILQKFGSSWEIHPANEGQIYWIIAAKPENCDWVAAHGLVKESDLD